jgi:hypothetical protein
VFENRVLRRIFGPKRDEVTGEWRKLHNEELHIFTFIHPFPVGSELEHRAPFEVYVITHTIRHTVELPWTSDQPVAEACTFTGQQNI